MRQLVSHAIGPVGAASHASSSFFIRRSAPGPAHRPGSQYDSGSWREGSFGAEEHSYSQGSTPLTSGSLGSASYTSYATSHGSEAPRGTSRGGRAERTAAERAAEHAARIAAAPYVRLADAPPPPQARAMACAGGMMPHKPQSPRAGRRAEL